MGYLFELPVWLTGVLIFALRIIDVSLGTCRTIAVVQGRMMMSVVLGFVEVLVRITTVANVIQHATNSTWLLLAYAARFAAGNAAGIYLERRLAMGLVILRIISETSGGELASVLGESVRRVFRVEGYHEQEPVGLLYVAIRRRSAPRLLAKAREVDPHLFYAVDTLRESDMITSPPLPAATGWRAPLKMK